MKKLIPLLAIAALCLSCSPVPFDLTLSQSAATVKRLTQDNATLITLDSNFANQGYASDFVFYPRVGARGFDYTSGMMTATSGLGVQMWGFAYNTSSGYYTQCTFWWQSLPNPDPQAPPYLAWPAKNGPLSLFGIAFDALAPLTSSFGIFTYDPLTSSTSMNGGDFRGRISTDFSFDGEVLGASVNALANPAYDVTHWLVRESMGTDFIELRYLVQAPALSGASAVRGAAAYPLPFVPSGINRCMYFYDENPAGDAARLPNRSFASWYDTAGARWISHAWWEDPVGTFHDAALPIDHRIDALLSSGQLLSTEGGTGRLYDRDGDLLAAFPLGNLVYIGEEYVNGAARTYFSQCLIFDNKQHFQVYGIETSALSTLGN
ncbi:MAG: hypothetical protein ABSF77_17420 [Spirochaetia bacterium]|jgi:hypothetical protein